ncbi:MAG: transcriptional repressor [Mucilaginibacter sp.]|nr:transcriptional repressor [Mucilaginibacter sp.]
MLPFRPSDTRPTLIDRRRQETVGLILALLKSRTHPESAEVLWLAFLKQGQKISITTFYAYLNNLSSQGLIHKNNAVGYKSYVYHL